MTKPESNTQLQSPFPNYGSPTTYGVPQQSLGSNGANYDIFGAIMRRKLIVILLAIFGALIGFLGLQNADKEFESTTELMVTSQAPPQIVDGETLVRSVSMPKFQRLMSSQLVARRAVQQHDLLELKSFEKALSPEMAAAELRQMVKIVASEQEQMMILSARGRYPGDLPQILNALVDAFRLQLKDGTRSDSEDSVTLISEMRKDLQQKKKDAEAESVAILVKLDLPNLQDNENIVNPYTTTLNDLTAQRSQLQLQRRELENRFQLAMERSKNENADVLTSLAAEAQSYLGFNMHNENAVSMSNERSIRGTERLLDAKSSIEQELSILAIKRRSSLSVYGTNHPKIKEMDSLIALQQKSLAEVMQQLEAVEQDNEELQKQQQDQTVASPESEMAAENQRWIDVYLESLRNEVKRVDLAWSQLEEEVKLVEQQAKEISDEIVRLRMLNKQIANYQSELEDLVQRLSSIDLVTNNFNDTKIEMISVPGEGFQVAPTLQKYLGGGIALGALIGVGIVLLIDQSEKTFRNPVEVMEKLRVPVISKIPAIRMGRGAKEGVNGALVSMLRPASNASEAIRAARAALFYASQQQNLKVFMLTSPSPGDGKTTISINLAISIAQAGKSVCLVDADLRRPRVHRYFGDAIEPGLLQVMHGVVELQDCYRTEGVELLTRLTAGGRPQNPGEIVTSRQFIDVISILREQFDYVIIDSPPILPVADATAIATFVDGVYMVMRNRKGVSVTAAKAKEKLDMVNANVLGVIINDVDENPHYNEFGVGAGYEYSNGRYFESRNSSYQEKLESID